MKSILALLPLLAACQTLPTTGLVVELQGSVGSLDRISAIAVIDGVERRRVVAQHDLALPTSFVAELPDRAAEVSLMIEAEYQGLLVGTGTTPAMRISAGQVITLSLTLQPTGAVPPTTPPSVPPSQSLDMGPGIAPPLPPGDLGSTTVPDAAPDLAACTSDCAQLSFVDTGMPFSLIGATLVIDADRERTDYMRYYGTPTLYGGSYPNSTSSNQVFGVSFGAWENYTTLPYHRRRAAATTYTNSTYNFLIGGIDENGVAQATTGAYTGSGWQYRASLITARTDHAAVRVGLDPFTIYAIGGRNAANPSGLASVEMHDPVMNTWQYGPALPEGRWGHAAAVIDGVIYIAGGENSDGPTSSALALVISTGAWTPIASMPLARGKVAGAAGADGRFYVIGGTDGTQATATVQAYSPSTNTWQVMPSLPQARFNVGATTISDGRILVASGESAEGIAGNGYTWTYGPNVNITNSPPSQYIGYPVDVTVTGSSFAPNSTVSIYFDSTYVAQAQASPTGTLPIGASFHVASCPSGHHEVTVVDNLSNYPVRKNFFVCQ